MRLFVSDDDTDALIKECNAWAEHFGQPLRLLMIDTFNKATRGADDIRGQDMGKVIDRIERIAEQCRCTVLVIDHLSAQGRFRGHGSKTGDLTTVIKVEGTDKVDLNNRKIKRLVQDKNKDGENSGTIPFVLRQLVIGYDEMDRPVTTLTVDSPDGDDVELEKSGRLPLNQSMFLRMLRDTIERHGEKPPGGLVGVPSSRLVISRKTFVKAIENKWVFKTADPTKRKDELQRALVDASERLQLAGYIDRDTERDLIWWTGKDDRLKYVPVESPRVM